MVRRELLYLTSITNPMLEPVTGVEIEPVMKSFAIITTSSYGPSKRNLENLKSLPQRIFAGSGRFLIRCQAEP